VLGSVADRADGIDTHIDDTVTVLKSMRSRLMDANVKVAIENHAGDMQARELKRLIESAGPECVGVCLDSGNPVWTIENPHLTLDTLAPYVLTSHIRDSALWNTPQGAAVRWTRMGEGNMGMEDYLRTYIQKCPGKAVSLEVIVSAQPRLFNYRDPKFWELLQHACLGVLRFPPLRQGSADEPSPIPRSRRPSGNWPTWKEHATQASQPEWLIAIADCRLLIADSPKHHEAQRRHSSYSDWPSSCAAASVASAQPRYSVKTTGTSSSCAIQD
jgi:hypothetical protein